MDVIVMIDAIIIDVMNDRIDYIAHNDAEDLINSNLIAYKFKCHRNNLNVMPNNQSQSPVKAAAAQSSAATSSCHFQLPRASRVRAPCSLRSNPFSIPP